MYFFATRLKHINMFVNMKYLRQILEVHIPTICKPPIPTLDIQTLRRYLDPPKHTDQTPSQEVCMGLSISLWISVVTDWFGDSIQNPRVRGSSRVKTQKNPPYRTAGRRCQSGGWKKITHIPTPNGILMVMNPHGSIRKTSPNKKQQIQAQKKA